VREWDYVRLSVCDVRACVCVCARVWANKPSLLVYAKSSTGIRGPGAKGKFCKSRSSEATLNSRVASRQKAEADILKGVWETIFFLNYILGRYDLVKVLIWSLLGEIFFFMDQHFWEIG